MFLNVAVVWADLVRYGFFEHPFVAHKKDRSLRQLLWNKK